MSFFHIGDDNSNVVVSVKTKTAVTEAKSGKGNSANDKQSVEMGVGELAAAASSGFVSF
jgi:hypothetical protein